jgi:hypothetical protein
MWLGLWLLASAISILRIAVESTDLAALVWAEDGLFPLCARKADFTDCLFDPFAGYLIAAPRVLAEVVAFAPLELWGVWTNVMAAVAWGALAPFIYFSLRTIHVTVPSALVIALSPVLIPLVGLESVNSIASIYMPLLFASTVLVLVVQDRGWTLWTAAALGFLAAVTIPLAGWLVVLILIRWAARRIQARTALIAGSATLVGTLLQLWVILTAEHGRRVAFTPDAFNGWLESTPNALLHLWPGINFGPTTVYGIFELPVLHVTGAIFVVGVIWLAVIALRRRTPAGSFIGLVLLSGLVYSFVPTVTGYASNRYFIPTALCIAAAGIVASDTYFSSREIPARSWFVAIALVLVWTAAFAGSSWRTTASPRWVEQIQQVQIDCAASPWTEIELRFSPDWPQPGTTELHAPTDARALCQTLIR